MTDSKTFTIPLRLRGLPAYVVSKAQLSGLHGFDRTDVVEQAVIDFRPNHSWFVNEGLTLDDSVAQGYVQDTRERERVIERVALNGNSFAVRPEFTGYPAYVIDWHVSGGLYGATRKGVVSGLLDKWVITALQEEKFGVSLAEARGLGYIPLKR